MDVRVALLNFQTGVHEMAPTSFFFGNALLHSRMETGLGSNQDFYDEDVNVYLWHLAASLVDPAALQYRTHYVVLRDTDMPERFASSLDVRLRFNCYRYTADHLLITISVFDSPTAISRHGGLTEERLLARSRRYYEIAAAFAQQLHCSAGVAQVLIKLANGAPKYRQILGHMAHEHLGLTDHLSPGDEFLLQRDIAEQAQQATVSQRWEELFEAKAQAEDEPSPEHTATYLAAIAGLKEVDPTFNQSKLAMPPETNTPTT